MLLLFLNLLIPLLAIGQGDPLTNGVISNVLEDFLESTDSENFDYNTIFENLNHYYAKPLNINNATDNELRDLFLINEIQIANFINHRAQNGSFLSIYELQAIPSWDLTLIRNVLPFLSCTVADDDFNLKFKDIVEGGRSQLYFKARRVLETRKGFIPRADGTKPYLGDPNQLYMRYRYEYGQLFKMGFTAEKDAGEEFFSGNNKKGFDFYSFFVYAKNINKRFSIISLGDFAVSMGQGLILHNDFGTGKSSYVMNVKKAGRSLRPYSSVNEVNFFRGGGAVMNLAPKVSLMAFASYRPIDASVSRDTTENNDFDTFGSIRFDGFHRTETEALNKNTINQTNFGAKLEYKTRDFKIAFNGLYTGFNKPLVRDEALYRKYLFGGSQLINASVDYSYRLKNFTFFGEYARSDNGGNANLHGVLMGLDRRIDISIVYRNFSPDYQVLNANAFAESTNPINEKGIYLGMEIRPFKNVVISAYLDHWKNPWVAFRRDGVGEGKESLIKIAYTQKRKLDLYIQYRYEQKLLNSNNEAIIDYPETQAQQRLRLHVAYKLTKEWEFRDRVEFSFFEKSTSSRGFLMYQDIVFKPIAKSISFSARYAIFDINSFDSRIYAYENDMLYEFYIPFFQNRGTRFYVNTRWRIARNYTWEFRVGRTYLENVNGIGSSNDFINGNTRTELKTQLRISF